jgi:hypothetical protein
MSGSLPAGAAGGGKKALLGEVQGFLLAQGLVSHLRGDEVGVMRREKV